MLPQPQCSNKVGSSALFCSFFLSAWWRVLGITASKVFFFSSGHYFIIIIIMDGWIESRIASMILLAIYTLIFFQIHPPHTWQNRIYWNGNAGGGLGGGGGRVQYCTVWCLAKRMPMGGGCGRIHHHLRSPPYKDDGTSLPGVRISAFTTGMRDT